MIIWQPTGNVVYDVRCLTPAALAVQRADVLALLNATDKRQRPSRRVVNEPVVKYWRHRRGLLLTYALSVSVEYCSRIGARSDRFIERTMERHEDASNDGDVTPTQNCEEMYETHRRYLLHVNHEHYSAMFAQMGDFDLTKPERAPALVWP